jgi:Na+/citrate or Na+/malate symporter
MARPAWLEQEFRQGDVMTEEGSMNEGERQAMMKSMMEQFFGGMSTDEKKEMCATMMGKMTEGLDMKEMMPKMMMGMISGGAGDGPGKMKEMMANKMQGGPEQHMSQMPEMMLKMMMPHCIGMMLPAIDAEKRGDVAGAILTAIVEKGTVGMSDEQKRSFLEALGDVLHPST